MHNYSEQIAEADRSRTPVGGRNSEARAAAAATKELLKHYLMGDPKDIETKMSNLAPVTGWVQHRTQQAQQQTLQKHLQETQGVSAEIAALQAQQMHRQVARALQKQEGPSPMNPAQMQQHLETHKVEGARKQAIREQELKKQMESDQAVQRALIQEQKRAAMAQRQMIEEAAARARAEELARQREEQEAYKAEMEKTNAGYFQPQQPLGLVIPSETNKYTIVDTKPLGVGVFSVVWACADKDNKLVALKVIRHQEHFRSFSEKEVLIMQRVAELSSQDEQGSAQVSMLRDHFVHRVGEVEHLCMTFEKLESNLRSVGKQPVEKVLKFSKQILIGLRYLHDFVGVVHCDVKPDNLLLRWDGLSVKLCDFGTSRVPNAELQAIDELQPLFYRAPEVFMGWTRGRKIDMWSAGATLYELATGRILFRSSGTHREVVENIMKIFGPLPAEMRDGGRLTRAYFSNQGFHPEVGTPVDPETTYRKVSMVTEIMPHIEFGKTSAKAAHDVAKAQLSKLIGKKTIIGGVEKKKKSKDDMSDVEKMVRQFANLVEHCMDLNPMTRFTAGQAVDHECMQAVELPPPAELQEAPPLPDEAPPPLPPLPPSADGAEGSPEASPPSAGSPPDAPMAS